MSLLSGPLRIDTLRFKLFGSSSTGFYAHETC